MQGLVAIVKVALLPGSLPFLLLALTLGIILLCRPRLQRWGRWWLIGLVAAYWGMSLPGGARLLSGLLAHGIRPIQTRAQAAGATAIVVLDGGTSRFHARDETVETVNRPSAFRALEAVRVYRLLDRPWVIVLGGTDSPMPAAQPEAACLRAEIAKAGVPSERILLDSISRNTHEHAADVAALLRSRQVERFVLVTSATHIRRASLAFAARGLTVVPSPAPEFSDRELAGWGSWWPSLTALQVSEDALRDGLALVYYWARGWLAPARPAAAPQP